MQTIKYISTCVVFITMNFSTFSQDADVDQLLDSAASKLNIIQSYTADAEFNFDIDFVKMPDKKAKISFSSPDEFNIDTDGFILIPKMGLKPIQEQLKREKYHPVYDGMEEVDGEPCKIVKMIPKERNNNVILSTFWIRESDHLIAKVESFTKRSGSFLLFLKYETDVLPSEMMFQFELEGMNIPLKYFGNEAEVSKAGFKKQEIKKGQISIYFTNYQITYN